LASVVKDDRKYTKDHEWTKEEGAGLVRIGISDHAQLQLTDVVFAELPEKGAALEMGKPFGVVESVKSASDIHSPITGEVVEVNQGVVEAPETLNRDPYGEGWLIVARVTGGHVHLMDAAQYKKHIGE
jgi:glycine cleavage system H protein